MAAEIVRVDPYDPRENAYAVGVQLAAELLPRGPGGKRRAHIKRRIVHIISDHERVVTEEEIDIEEDLGGGY